MEAEYKELKLLKQSEKSTVYLVCSGERKYIRKVLAGQHPVYEVLRDNPHPGLPGLLEVTVSENSTTILEEYIEGQPLGTVELSKRQFSTVVKELCSVLTFLHQKGIIHRDIKPSNIMLTEEGHVYLIDFDIARMPREGLDQDTRQLGTRGFASPEQYGFSQTDQRTDIYALGTTLKLLLTKKTEKPHYRKVLQKCTNLDPDQRYRSVEQFQRAFFPTKRNLLWSCTAVCLSALIGICAWKLPALLNKETAGTAGKNVSLPALPMPENVHWNGETGIAEWDNVPDAKIGEEIQFHFRLYRQDTADTPNPEDDSLCYEALVRMGGKPADKDVLSWNVVKSLSENGLYYFTVSAAGDNIQFTDSPYAMSDVFEYTGEAAPPLPAPEGLAWRLVEKNNTRYYYATWSNLDDYEDNDTFNVTFYDETGTYVMNNTWPLYYIKQEGYGGIIIRSQFLVQGHKYRFTVQAYSSRPNEYSSSPMPDPVPEEYYSPWLIFGPPEEMK